MSISSELVPAIISVSGALSGWTDVNVGAISVATLEQGKQAPGRWKLARFDAVHSATGDMASSSKNGSHLGAPGAPL